MRLQALLGFGDHRVEAFRHSALLLTRALVS